MAWRGRSQRIFVAAIAAATLVAGVLSGQLELAVWLAPLCLVALPLAGGRYLGERRMERLRRGGPRRRTAARPRLLPSGHRVFPRGGRLLGHSLAVRPPPARLVP